MNRLMIGPGTVRREGWQTLDANSKLEPHFVASIPPVPEAVSAIAWDEIEWIHGITSLYPWDAITALKELLGILRPGGKLVLEQPNFRQAVHRIEWLFGDPVFKNPLIMNRWAYTPDGLAEILQSIGYTRIDLLAAIHHVPARDFRIEAYR